MMTVKRIMGVWCGLALWAGMAEGQIAGRWVEQKCGLRPGHSLVTSGVLYLKRGVETKFEDERKKQLGDAERVLLQALTTGAQQQNPAAWYYLGRLYLVRNDAAGADSALTRAQQLRPECAEDIDIWRDFLWRPVFNAGVAAWQDGDTDSAAASFTRATALNPKDPNGPIYLAILHANSDRVDSAIKYFRRGIEVAGDDTAYADDKRQAIFNLARMFHRRSQGSDAAAAANRDTAATTYRGYLQTYGPDAEATAALASLYSAAGQRDSATTLYRSVLERADSVTFLELFQAGVAIYRGAPQAPDTAAALQQCRAQGGSTPAVTRRRCMAVRDSLLREYRTATQETFALAAQAFEAVLQKNPFYRDALYNLANTYFQVRDTAKMLPIAQRLVAVDPMNRTSNLLLAQAYQMRARGDSALHYLQVSDSILPLEVTVTELALNDSSTAVGGLVTNFHDKASAPTVLAFEFLNTKGDVVAAQDYEVPAVEPQGNHAFRVEVGATGVAAYRYRRK